MIIVWQPNCYFSWQNILPTPIASLSVNGTESIYVIPDAVEFVQLIPPGFAEYYDSIGFNWQRLAGAKVTQIEGMDPYDYVDMIANNYTGNFLDHGVRVNSVFSGYRLQTGSYSQRLGDLAGQLMSDKESITMNLVTVNSTEEETVTVPYLMVFMGAEFSDGAS